MGFKRGYIQHEGRLLWLVGGTGANGERDGAVIEATEQNTANTEGLWGKGVKGLMAFVALTPCEHEALYQATNFYYG